MNISNSTDEFLYVVRNSLRVIQDIPFHQILIESERICNARQRLKTILAYHWQTALSQQERNGSRRAEVCNEPSDDSETAELACLIEEFKELKIVETLPFNAIPTEIVEHIFHSCPDYHTVLAFAMTCVRTWHIFEARGLKRSSAYTDFLQCYHAVFKEPPKHATSEKRMYRVEGLDLLTSSVLWDICDLKDRGSIDDAEWENTLLVSVGRAYDVLGSLAPQCMPKEVPLYKLGFSFWCRAMDGGILVPYIWWTEPEWEHEDSESMILEVEAIGSDFGQPPW